MLELRDITKTYRQRKRVVTALDHVTLQIPDGSVFGIAGRSGAGKSTLIRVLDALEIPDSGEVLLDGKNLLELGLSELKQQRRHIGMVFQHFNLLHSKTVRENIEFPLVIAGESRKARHDRGDELMELVGLSDKADNYPSQLSGGQKQRVGIARALAPHPTMLLSDEATSALDPETTEQIIDLLLRINRDLGLTIILITHELGLLRRYATEVAALENGKKVDEGRVLDLILNPGSKLGAELLPGFTKTPLPDGTVRVLLTTNGEGSGRDFLSNLSFAVAQPLELLSGGVYEVSGTNVGRFEIAYPEGDAQRSILERSAEQSRVQVRYR